MIIEKSTEERRKQLELILQAARDAVREALRRHMLLGESVAVADESGPGNGKGGGNGVKILGPDEIRKVLEAD